jgi:NAD(P)H-dependent FMN reductase
MHRLTVIVASTRPGRVGRRIGDWFAAIAEADDRFRVRLVDLAELNLPFHDEPNQPSDGGPYLYEHTRRWSAIVDASDAFVLVMPEYNRGYSAPLKNALDYLYREWHHKPVGIVSYGMTSAGLRAAELVTPVLVALKMLPVPECVAVPLRQALDPDGRVVPTPAMAPAAVEMLDELADLTDRLYAGRSALAVHSGANR